MNVDIINIGIYRVTSHGGRAYDLYNRNSGAVYPINVEEYAFIRNTNTEDRCDEVYNKYWRKANGLDVT